MAQPHHPLPARQRPPCLRDGAAAHEQFKIPENLARFAVRHGMTGFVKKMGPAVREFVACRRRRISPVRPPLPLRCLFQLFWAHALPCYPLCPLAILLFPCSGCGAKHFRAS